MRATVPAGVTRQHIRQTIRKTRRALSTSEQNRAAQALLARCQVSDTLKQAHHIALYLTNDGELDTEPLIHWLWQAGKHVYLPVLHPFSKGHLLFLGYSPNTPMAPNRFGIAEPVLDIRRVCPIANLDVVCTPLVAFDATGHRLGMGGGYYDRTLSRWHHHREGPRPIGLAHDCQQVASLPSQSWDVPLPEIITPSHHYRW
ncbi:5-formyltetrahydrofolate cyclo-ligase [Photobacterium aquae]|uniref:5-formyltetrahydrofolate cyclo-ligase n=1 Tax=Photobacterium aquae TaxID=1195763 RepID=A0A0J1H510_9GAMM|nr:5-formyltetrahydrofolate cyclo-ligase [Photobacterium aquae]KLV06801.1 5-formyltetrahydrofolate cyclo-ligase [Photobacterium aquae]